METLQLKEFKINVRLKLSALWTAVMFCYIYGDYFELYVPGKVGELLNGKNIIDSPMKLLAATLVLAIPSMMIFLSLMLQPSLTKWLNIVVGIFFTLFTLLVGISSIAEWRIFYVCLSFLESILTLIITWQAWNWEKMKTE
ncbi:MAG: DUF6326 family protein [Ginsengibacter sp.]